MNQLFCVFVCVRWLTVPLSFSDINCCTIGVFVVVVVGDCMFVESLLFVVVIVLVANVIIVC